MSPHPAAPRFPGRGAAAYLGANGVSLRYDEAAASHMLRCDHPGCVAVRWCGRYGMERPGQQVDAYQEGWRRHWLGDHGRDLCPAHADE